LTFGTATRLGLAQKRAGADRRVHSEFVAVRGGGRLATGNLSAMARR
jgi:hypothetical protein